VDEETVVIKDITADCYTEETDWGPQVHYRGVPLWMTVYEDDPKDLPGTEIKIIRDFTTYTILGKTPVVGFDDVFDYSTYGDWESLEEVLSWMHMPYPLY
jgi:hypothetical protein